MKFLLNSLKTLTNSKSCSKSRIKFLFKLSFALIGKFFLAYIHCRLSEQFSESQADFGTTFKGTSGYQKSGTSSLKRVTGRNFPISKWFLEASRNFILDFLHKRQLKIVKTISAHSKSTVSKFTTFKKIFISCHYPFICFKSPSCDAPATWREPTRWRRQSRARPPWRGGRRRACSCCRCASDRCRRRRGSDREKPPLLGLPLSPSPSTRSKAKKCGIN